MKPLNLMIINLCLLIILVACGNLAAAPNAAPPVDNTAPATTSEAAAFPVNLINCGLEITVEAAPKRAVTMNQSTTEIMLALGLEDVLIGTAYIDDEILPEYQTAYQQIPILAEQYPSQEVLFGADPDFVYGGFASAFGDEAAGTRQSLIDLSIIPYLSSSSCENTALRPETASMSDVYSEIMDVGRIFGIEDRAENLVADMQANLDDIQQQLAAVETPARVLWYDSGDDEPFIGVGTGVPNLILTLAGAENVFADVPGAWETLSWEEIIAREADAIVIIEADWSTAAEKMDLLKSTEAYAGLSAVQQERFIIIPFSYTTAGVRNAAAVDLVARGLYPGLFE